MEYIQSVYCKTSSLSEYNGVENILGIVQYGDTEAIPEDFSHIPHIWIPMPVAGSRTCYELWLSDRVVTYRAQGSVTVGFDGDVLFGCGSFGGRSESLNPAAYRAYHEIFHACRSFSYPNIYRMWNYIPGIVKKNDSGRDRYEDYSYGRACAFSEWFGDTEPHAYPAATGVGVSSDTAGLYFLASAKETYTPIENPRQVAAYQYPEKYGLKRPSFSRAICIRNRQGSTDVCVSGTASIVEAETRHVGDVKLQCLETLQNIRELISRKNLERYGLSSGFTPKDLYGLKVYVKKSEDVADVKRVLDRELGGDNKAVYLITDICRDDLLVEIEGIASEAPRGAKDVF